MTSKVVKQKMKKNKYNKIIKEKRFLTLLEVLIATALLSVLLTIVFGFFRELSILSQDSKKTLQQGFEKRFVESRLSYVFSHTIAEDHKAFYFYTMRDELSRFPSLILTFQNNASSEKAAQNSNIIGRLFVDDQKRFCLAYLPLKKNKEDTDEKLLSQVHVECLMENIEEMQFTFLTAPDVENTVLSTTNNPPPPPPKEPPGSPKKPVVTDPKQDQKEEDNSKKPPKGAKLNEWNKEFKELPIIVKIELKQTGSLKPIVYAFVMTSSKHPITFISPK